VAIILHQIALVMLFHSALMSLDRSRVHQVKQKSIDFFTSTQQGYGTERRVSLQLITAPSVPAPNIVLSMDGVRTEIRKQTASCILTGLKPRWCMQQMEGGDFIVVHEMCVTVCISARV
jgi:hypothetical protein